MQGSFYNSQIVPGGKVCVSIWVFEGQTFRQLSFYVDSDLYQELAADSPEEIQNEAQTQCSDLHTGSKSGVFEISGANELSLNYTDGYDFRQNSSFALLGEVVNDCPNILLKLDRSSIPVIIQRGSWLPPEGVLRAYDQVNSTMLSCGGGIDGPGYCLRRSQLSGRDPATLRMRRMAGVVDSGASVFAERGILTLNGWRRDVATKIVLFPNGSLCTLVMEQSNLMSTLIYVRTHIYGCLSGLALLPPRTSAPTQNTSNTTSSSGMLSSTTIPVKSTPRFSTSVRFSTGRHSTTPLILSTLIQTGTTSFASTSAITSSTACAGIGDLNLHAGTSATPYALSCPTGSINVLNYAVNLERHWTIVSGDSIAVWMSSLVGFGVNQDYITITSSNLPKLFITGANSDPTSDIRIKECFGFVDCVDGARYYTLREFNLSLIGPLRVSFVSNAITGNGGAMLQYAVQGLGQLRAVPNDNIAVQLESSPFHVRRALTVTGSNVSVSTVPIACTCGLAGNISCPSLFFQSPVCLDALSTWSWLTYHAMYSVSSANFTGYVDAVVYFERFQNFQASKTLYVTASFGIFASGIAHYLDVIALFKGEDDDAGSCDQYRTFGSCSRRSPFGNPPTLQKQLCWAYTSALVNPWGDAHVPNPSIVATGGSVNFCSDVTESAGPGVYYVVLYSFKLKGIIAQIDYIQMRDCHGVSFPCSPQLILNPNRQFDVSGPLAVCPVMWYRNSNFACTPCPVGTVSGLLNSPSCFSCPVGQYSPFPHTGLDSCTSCTNGAANISALDPSVAIQCKFNSSLLGKLVGTTSAALTTSVSIASTPSPRYCGDGMLTYDGGITFSSKECDAGPPDTYSRSSSTVSIFSVLGSGDDVRNALQQRYRICSRVDCKLSTYYCGDGIWTQYSPVYSLSNCVLNHGNVLCESDAQVAYRNKTIVYNEECDDDNYVDGDGCSSKCTVEPLFRCEIFFCRKTCPNGVVDLDTGEKCDDGNSLDGDGCSSSCQIECGFVCSSQPSKCATVCGDGIIAGEEDCDTALVLANQNNPNRQGCNSYCKQEHGWACMKPVSICDSNMTNPQYCSPICGDGITYYPEECDDADWNLADKACLPDCRLNRLHVCYGPSCLSPTPGQLQVTQGLISSLQNDGQNLAEGVLVLRDNFVKESWLLSRSLTMIISKYASLPTIFPSMFLSFPTALSTTTQSNDYPSSLTAPFCTKPSDTTISASSGRIMEEWNFLANNVSCLYKILPRPSVNSARYIVLAMKFSDLDLNGDSYLEVSSSQAFSSQANQMVCRFHAPFRTADLIQPIYLLAPVSIQFFGSAQSTQYRFAPQSMLKVDLNYITLNDTETSPDAVLCLARCQCNNNCSSKCFKSAGLRSYPFKTLLRSIDVSKAQDSSVSAFEVSNYSFSPYPSQVIAINFEPSGNPEPQHDYIFPAEFSQYPSTSLLASLARDSTLWNPSLDHSWRGYCFYRFTVPQIICDVVLHVSQSTIVKHIWNCPLRGYSLGRIIHMDTDPSVALDPLFVISYFRNGRLIWTKAGVGDTPDAETSYMIGSGYFTNLSSQRSFQIAFEGSTKMTMGIPKFVNGGMFEQEDNCKVLNMDPYQNLTSVSGFQSTAPEVEADAYLACNQSLAQAIVVLQGNSYECLTLVRALLMRDFWAPLNLDVTVLNSEFESESIRSYACRSPCKDLFVSEVQKSLDTCQSAWKGPWSNWDTASRTFKLLITVVTSLYWYSVMCLSNHEERSCADFSLLSRKLLNKTYCPPLLDQSLVSPQFLSSGVECNVNCSSSVSEYINRVGCCAPSIESAGAWWLQTLTNPTVSSIAFDFGDRTNPFNSTFPANGGNPVVIRFNTQGTVKILPSGIVTKANTETIKIRTMSDLVNSDCKSCNWPYQNQQCCNTFSCINGNKSYAGACSCICPDGLQGDKCDLQGYFAQALLHFDIIAATFPGQNFSYCQLKEFYDTASTIFSVPVEDLILQPLPPSTRRISASGMLALFRIRVTSCSDAQRMTQKVSSLSDASVLSLFLIHGIPTPVITSIWAFCDGKQTACGSGSNFGGISQQVVFAACTAGLVGNSSLESNSYSSRNSAFLTDWKLPVLAFGSIVFVCLCGGLVFYSRVRIAKRFIRTYKVIKKKGEQSLAKLSEKDTKDIIPPEADIVFKHDGTALSPREFFIISEFEPMDIELKFMHTYSAKLDVESSVSVSAQDGLNSLPENTLVQTSGPLNSTATDFSEPYSTSHKPLPNSPFYHDVNGDKTSDSTVYPDTNRSRSSESATWINNAVRKISTASVPGRKWGVFE